MLCCLAMLQRGENTARVCELKWVFGAVGEGKCQLIPQMEDGARSGPAARTRTADPACATAFPCTEAGGILFVFMVPGADGLLQSAGCAPPPQLRLHPTAVVVPTSPTLTRFEFKFEVRNFGF